MYSRHLEKISAVATKGIVGSIDCGVLGKLTCYYWCLKLLTGQNTSMMQRQDDVSLLLELLLDVPPKVVKHHGGGSSKYHTGQSGHTGPWFVLWWGLEWYFDVTHGDSICSSFNTQCETIQGIGGKEDQIVYDNTLCWNTTPGRNPIGPVHQKTTPDPIRPWFVLQWGCSLVWYFDVPYQRTNAYTVWVQWGYSGISIYPQQYAPNIQISK